MSVLPVPADALGQAKIGNFGNEGREASGEGRAIPGLIPQKDVGGLEIAVNYTIGMRGMDGPGQGLDELCRLTHRLWLALEVLGQTAARDELKDEVRPTAGL